MVSIEGYTTNQIIYSVILCYVMVFCWAITRYMNYIIEKEAGEETKNRSLLIFLIGVVFVSLIMYVPVRIGTLTFIAGAFTSLAAIDLLNVFKRWSPFSSSSRVVSETKVEVDAVGNQQA